MLKATSNHGILMTLLAGRQTVRFNPDKPAMFHNTWSKLCEWPHTVMVSRWETSITVKVLVKTSMAHVHTRQRVEVPSCFVVRYYDNGTHSFSRNGKGLHDAQQNARLARAVSNILVDQGVEVLQINSRDLYLEKNPRLKDLLKYTEGNIYGDVSAFMQMSPYLRSCVYKAYDAEGSKAAYKALLGVNCKPLLAMAWNYPGTAAGLRRAIHRGEDPQRMAALLEKSDYKEHLALLMDIYPAVKAFNATKDKVAVRFVCDLVQLHRKLKKEFGVVVKLCHNVRKDHDMVAREYTQRKLVIEGSVKLPSCSIPDHTSGRYSIVLPKTGMEVLDNGLDLNICVGGYLNDIKAGRKIVFLVKKDGENHGCLELSTDHKLVQAKLYRNALVGKCEETTAVVSEWVELNQIPVVCNNLCGVRPHQDDELPW